MTGTHCFRDVKNPNLKKIYAAGTILNYIVQETGTHRISDVKNPILKKNYEQFGTLRVRCKTTPETNLQNYQPETKNIYVKN